MIGIINYGMGNLASVKNALDFLNVKSTIIDDPDELRKVDKIILPGVGAFGMAMQNLHKSGFALAIQESVLVRKIPILGICLGMQLLFESSTEHGLNTGLGIADGRVLFLGEAFNSLPIPHIGWNSVEYNDRATLFNGLNKSPTYYFVHSYYCEILNPAQVAGVTEYGIIFHSSLEANNVFGCQFHPEKSQKNGLTVYSNFNKI